MMKIILKRRKESDTYLAADRRPPEYADHNEKAEEEADEDWSAG